ncbi:unnamed protein product [Rhizophagus irregularis]|uniref:Uncharacterized protein n=1 Tax=Rhizophagus irregularis TaxID=588596 RepID=A0A915YPM4_9GLOM|nr:unnamed protein product [Rhizophagus irregularis]CAB5304099.1 unnamed protein product [Rhizophagus irregularis]CAB5377308.1 unnamed protein product [Rhizophagus irregularis]
MGRYRKRKSVPKTRKTQHLLPHVDLSEDSNETTKDSEQNVTEEHLNDTEEHLNDDDTLLVPDDADDGRAYISSDNEDEVDVRRKDTEEEESNVRKKIKIESTLCNMQLTQNRMFTMIQAMQKNVNEMYLDWKSTGGFGSHAENDTKWMEEAVSQAVYTLSEKVKYPSDERIMQVCYDALADIGNEDFLNIIKRGGWKRFFNKNIRSLAQRYSRQARSNIVQRVKDAIHSEFENLVKPKTENRQVTCDEERKFKNSEVTRECYKKLNQPIDPDNDLHYTYLNSIIDNVFTDPHTEKNSIAFGMAITLNYLDPSKGINMVPSEVIDRMNGFLEKMKVVREEL